jgi:hypothetical protein
MIKREKERINSLYIIVLYALPILHTTVTHSLNTLFAYLISLFAFPFILLICSLHNTSYVRTRTVGFGMWTPRAHIEYDLLNIIHEAPNGYKPDFLIDNAYNGFDLLPLLQELPDDDIDVHAIAIATSNPEPTDIDHNWVENDNDNEENISNNTTNSTADTAESTTPKPPSRRWLQSASELAFRKGSELFMDSATSATITTIPSVSGSNFNNNKKISSDEKKNKNSNNHPRRKMIRNRKLQENGDDNDTSVTVANATAAAAAAAASTTKKTYGENDIVPGRGWVVSTHKYIHTHTHTHTHDLIYSIFLIRFSLLCLLILKLSFIIYFVFTYLNCPFCLPTKHNRCMVGHQ